MIKNANILKKIILFFVLIITINTAFSWVYYKKFAKKKKYFKSDLMYTDHGYLASTLVLGHSRADFGVNDSLMEKTFNYASFGESNVYTYYKLKKLLKNPNHIKRIIIPVGWSSFFSYKQPNLMDHSYWNRYLDYRELGAINNNKFSYFSIYLQSKVVPYAKMLVSEINKKGTNFKEEKIDLFKLTTEQEKYDFAAYSIEHHFNDRNYYDTVSYLYLDKFLSLCKENNIEIIAVRFPITKYYKKVFKEKAKLYNFKEEDFMNLFNKYNIEVWNEEDFFIENEVVFKDVHHLNNEGGNLFTKYLNEKLN